MLRITRIVPFFLIAASAGAAFFIIQKGSAPGKESLIARHTDARAEAAPARDAVPQIPLKDTPSKNEFQIPPELLSQEESSLQSQNFTEAFAGQIFKKFITENPEGPSLIEGKSYFDISLPAEYVQKALGEGLKDFDYDAFKESIASDNVVVQPSESRDGFLAYVGGINRILEAHPAALGPTPSLQEIERVRKETVGMIDDLLALPVPPSLTSWHLELLTLLATRKKIYTALLETEDDPLRAYLAVRAWQRHNQEFDRFYRESFSAFP